MDNYFSDREKGYRPRTSEDISDTVWEGIVGYISSELDKGSFGLDFPLECPDGGAIYGSDAGNLERVLHAEIPDISWPLYSAELPDKYAILDFIEFCYEHIAEAVQGAYHSFFRHYHLTFDREKGQGVFRSKINRIFARNGIAFNLDESGQVIRLTNPVLHATISNRFKTGDQILDDLIEQAQNKFLDPNQKIRKEALEKLWDAWERVKTIEPGKNKKEQVKKILDKAATESNFRELLEREAKELTDIGNKFMIRHSETTQTKIQNENQVDYLFHRMFSLINLLLERS